MRTDTTMIGGIGNRIRTWTLLAALGGLLVVVGGLLGGIASPFGRTDVGSLFSTHPPIEARVARLHALRRTPAAAGASAAR